MVFLVSNILNDIPWQHSQGKVATEHKKPETGRIFPDKQYAVAVHKKLLQGCPLAYGHGFFMIDQCVEVDMDFVPCLPDTLAPVELLIIKEIVLGHPSRFLQGRTADHHRGPVRVAGWAGKEIVLPAVLLELSDTCITAGIVVHRSITCVLQHSGLVEIMDLGGNHADLRVGFHGVHQLADQPGRHFGVVIDQEKVIARGVHNTDVVPAREAGIHIRTDEYNTRVPLLPSRHGVCFAPIIDDDDFQIGVAIDLRQRFQ